VKNAVFWNVTTQFLPHRRQSTSPLQSLPAGCCVIVEVFIAVTMNNSIFCDVTQCGSCRNRHFGGRYHLYHHGGKNRRATINVGTN
jgi:hypothetical protein